MTQWMIDTRGDPLGTLRDLVQALWQQAQITVLLAPVNGSIEHTGPILIQDPVEIEQFNPFTPLMPINAALLVRELLHLSGDGQAAAILRPCELRTLQAMQRNGEIDTGDLLTVCVDCLGTLPADEFEWRANRKGSPKGLAQEALQFARQGGIVPYRYRAACQVCLSPRAEQADINIGVIGLPVRQNLLLQTSARFEAQRLALGRMDPADPELVEQHAKVVDRLVERGAQTRGRIGRGLASVLPANVDELVEQLASCGDCSVCLDECPLCQSSRPQRDSYGYFQQDEIINWLVSCSGCGMCEQACPQHLPLTIIFGHIRDQLESPITL
ncbi:MAG: 4Fe-4S dicluster domain-containing protein [Anaerolineales bacterium]|nr:4Fe-4S dicluster domain-containing protein [Anaerolineales bacterium]